MTAKRGRRTPPEGVTMRVVHANARLEAYLRRRTWGVALGSTLLVVIWLARAFVELLGP